MSNARQPDERICRRCIYRGRVQGVGFRMTAASIARRFAVAGYVRNLRSGDVELVVTGADEAVQQFLSGIEAAFAGYISHRSIEPLACTEAFSGFEIRY